MNNYLNDQSNHDEVSPHLWAERHGVAFLLHVLWELGHPQESNETLEEVIESVHKKTGALIINLEDADYLNEVKRELDANDYKHLLAIRQERIDTRNGVIQL